MTDIDLDVPDELQSRLVGAAKRCGLSEHEFILKAIAEKLALDGCEARASDSVDAAKAIAELREARRGVSVGEGDPSDLITDGRR